MAGRSLGDVFDEGCFGTLPHLPAPLPIAPACSMLPLPSDLSATCAICLLELTSLPSPAGEEPPLPFSMPCCSSSVHLLCLHECLQRRAIRKTCSCCQCAFSPALGDTVGSLLKEAQRAARVERRVTLAALSQGCRLFDDAGGSVETAGGADGGSDVSGARGAEQCATPRGAAGGSNSGKA